MPARVSIHYEVGAIYVQGSEIPLSPKPVWFEGLLSPYQSRKHEAGGRAPHGHRANIVHVYDQLGLTITEHHESRLATELAAEFGVEVHPRSPTKAFSGEFLLGGLRISHNTCRKEIVDDSGIEFVSIMNDWYRTAEGIWPSLRATFTRRGRLRRIAVSLTAMA